MSMEGMPGEAVDTAKELDPFDRLRNSMRAKRVPMLDVVRALAAMLVVVDHFRLTLGRTGTVGVTIFFALSGYLITGLLIAENRKTGDVSLPGFYKRRVMRIFPAFWVFWLVYIGIMLVERQSIPWPQAISSLLYYSNYYWGLTGVAPLMVITWSLSIENQFYLLWPLLFRWWKDRQAWLVWGTAGLVVAAFLVRVLESVGLHFGLDYMMYAFEARADSLMIGCLLAITVANGRARWFVNVVAARSFGIAVSLALLIWSGQETLNNTYNVLLRSGLEAAFAALLIVQLLALRPDSLWQWVNNGVTRFLGKISYSMYLYHGLCRRFVESVLNLHEIYTVALVGFACTVVVSTASFYLVEQTFIRLGRTGKSAAARVEPGPALAGEPASKIAV